MTNYKAVKINFDLDDPYQLKLYNYVKDKTNGSSYMRTLIHVDMNSNKDIVREQIQPETNVIKIRQTESKVKAEPVGNSIVIDPPSNNVTEDIIVEGLF